MSGFLSIIAARSRLTLADARNIIATAPVRYKVYQIPKKGGGQRIIAHPAKELKVIQRVLVDLYPPTLLVHPCSTAYEEGSSIVGNAARHAGKKWLSKFDIKDFFNSLRPDDWDKVLASSGVSDELREISKLALFWKSRFANDLCLSVGAPSSPFVVNRLMYQFDVELEAFCKERSIEYTRYADDIALSADVQMPFNELKSFVSDQLSRIGSLALNENKCRQLGPGSRKQVTGLILSEDGRVTLGRRRKRNVEAMVFNFLRGQIPDADLVRGHLAFAKLADPLGYARLKAKFGQHDRAKQHKLFS